MFGGAYGNARMPNWPHKAPHPLAMDRLTEPVLEQRANTLMQTTFSSASGVCGWCNSPLLLFRILDFAGPLAASGCLGVRPAWIIFFLFRCWVANGKHEGMLRSDIERWVAAAVDHLCHSRVISILRHILKATKVATWSYLSALFSIIGTKLSGVFGEKILVWKIGVKNSV